MFGIVDVSDHGTLEGLGDDDHPQYLLIDGTRAMTGTLTAQDIVPTANQTRNVGLDGNQFLSSRARLGVFVGTSDNTGAPVSGTGVRSFGSNPTGLMAGSQREDSTGVASHYLRGGPYKGVACVGNASALGAGNATLRTGAAGGSLFGTTFAGSSGNATMENSGYGGFMAGYVYSQGSNNHLAAASGTGAFTNVYTGGLGTATIRNLGSGAFLSIAANITTASGSANATCSGNGAFLQGAIDVSFGGASTFRATQAGSFAQGVLQGTSAEISSLGRGSFAQGFANFGIIQAVGDGSIAHGIATAGYSIVSSGSGSLAVGAAINAGISATAANTFQFGAGANAQQDSLQVGNGGIRFKGTPGPPAVPQNGDFWVTGAYVYVQSNGVAVQIAGPGPLTN